MPRLLIYTYCFCHASTPLLAKPAVHGRGGGRRLLDMASNGEIEQTIVVTGLGASDNRATDDDVFYLFLQKQKIGAELHIPLGRYVP